MYCVEYNGLYYERYEQSYSGKDRVVICRQCHNEREYSQFPLRYKDHPDGNVCGNCLGVEKVDGKLVPLSDDEVLWWAKRKWGTEKPPQDRSSQCWYAPEAMRVLPEDAEDIERSEDLKSASINRWK